MKVLFLMKKDVLELSPNIIRIYMGYWIATTGAQIIAISLKPLSIPISAGVEKSCHLIGSFIFISSLITITEEIFDTAICSINDKIINGALAFATITGVATAFDVYIDGDLN